VKRVNDRPFGRGFAFAFHFFPVIIGCHFWAADAPENRANESIEILVSAFSVRTGYDLVDSYAGKMQMKPTVKPGRGK
jgi:hypothetical protein